MQRFWDNNFNNFKQRNEWASLLGNILAGKGIVRAGSGRRSLNSSNSYGNKKGKGILRAGYGNRWDF